jgi:hypothetical protein
VSSCRDRRNRLQFNPATAIPLPTERQKPARYLSQLEVERLVAEIPRQYRALVLVGAYTGLRWGEAAGLRRRHIDPCDHGSMSCIPAVEVRGRVTLDNEPKTTRSKRSVPVARSIMRSAFPGGHQGGKDHVQVALEQAEVPYRDLRERRQAFRSPLHNQPTSPASVPAQTNHRFVGGGREAWIGLRCAGMNLEAVRGELVRSVGTCGKG